MDRESHYLRCIEKRRVEKGPLSTCSSTSPHAYRRSERTVRSELCWSRSSRVARPALVRGPEKLTRRKSARRRSQARVRVDGFELDQRIVASGSPVIRRVAGGCPR